MRHDGKVFSTGASLNVTCHVYVYITWIEYQLSIISVSQKLLSDMDVSMCERLKTCASYDWRRPWIAGCVWELDNNSKVPVITAQHGPSWLVMTLLINALLTNASLRKGCSYFWWSIFMMVWCSSYMDHNWHHQKSKKVKKSILQYSTVQTLVTG